MIIDGKNAVLGRLATFTAKELLKGEPVEIINAGRIIITGNPKQVLNKYISRKQKGSPQHGPFFPRSPSMITRRAIRGMLPKTRKGAKALRRLRVYEDSPKDKKDAKSIAVKEVKTNFIYIRDLSKSMGWNK